MHRRGILKYFAGLMLGAPAVQAIPKHQLPASRTRLCILDTRIAGFAHYQGEACLPFMKSGDALDIRREPGNSKDSRAIEVYWRNKKIGYVPRIQNRALSRIMDQGYELHAQIKRIDDGLLWEPLYFEVSLIQ